MKSRLCRQAAIEMANHPKFTNVRIGVCVTAADTDTVSVCMLEIAAETTIPIHTHDPQVDSIYVVSGRGQAFVNGEWTDISAGDYLFVPANEEHGIRAADEPLRLFVHHSPPLM